jgi:hypothetical protein
MPIAIACPHCDWKGRVPDNLAGRKGKCPTCGELVPIPKKGTPPPVPAGQKAAVDDEPDLVDDADIVEDEPRPPAKRPAPGRRLVEDNEDDDRSARSRRRADDEDDEDDRPRKARRRDEDDEDERPRKARRRDDDDEDERPARSRRRPADDDEEDERPARSRRRDNEDDDEDRPRKRRPVEDDDEAERPRKTKRRGGPKRRSGGGRTLSSKKIGQLVASLLFLLLGVGLVALYFINDNPNKRPPIWGGLLIISSLLGIGQAAANPYEDD